MPAGFSGLCVRKEIQRDCHHPETDFAGRRGNDGESPFQERKAACI